MEQNSPAEELPALYRAILDRVAELEREGSRAEAGRVRAAATRIYSRAWDPKARRGLEDLLKRAVRPPSDEAGVEGSVAGRSLPTGSPAIP
jgi:hypothetical protein